MICHSHNVTAKQILNNDEMLLQADIDLETISSSRSSWFCFTATENPPPDIWWHYFPRIFVLVYQRFLLGLKLYWNCMDIYLKCKNLSNRFCWIMIYTTCSTWSPNSSPIFSTSAFPEYQGCQTLSILEQECVDLTCFCDSRQSDDKLHLKRSSYKVCNLPCLWLEDQI